MLESINRFLTGPVMVWSVIIIGVILTCKTRFIQATKLPLAIKQTFTSLFSKGGKNAVGITPFQAVTTALSGTIGTGNIVGVATAISIGGAGALFWMWVSAFFGMATKYSEIVLAIKFRKKVDETTYIGGPMYYLNACNFSSKPKGDHKNLLSVSFALLCVLSSFGIGNMVQANAISDAISSVSSVNISVIMVVIALLVGFVIIGGIKRIAKTTEALIPAMAIFYMVGCLAIIVMNWEAIPKVFAIIFESAFDMTAATGGVLGLMATKAVRIGFSRGVFTNEAGLGSAPIAHAAADAKSPAHQGLLGIFEVFFDTIIMCTLTGVVIILSGLYQDPAMEGATLTLSAFNMYLGKYAMLFIAISTVFFAVSSIIGWSYYGQACLTFLFHSKKLELIYKLIYIAVIYVGAVISLDFVWAFSDLLNGLMMLPNLLGVVMLSHIVRDETAIFNKKRH